MSPTLTSWGANGEYDKRMTEVFELRLAVETMAARLAADRVTQQDTARLEECQRALEAAGDVHAFRRADSEFHLAVARISGNGMLSNVVEDVRAAVSSRLDQYDFAVISSRRSGGTPASSTRSPSAIRGGRGSDGGPHRGGSAEVMAVLSEVGLELPVGSDSPSAG